MDTMGEKDLFSRLYYDVAGVGWENNNYIKQNNIMCVKLNKACCRLYQAFEIKSATYLANLSFIKKVNKSIPDMTEIFTTVGSIKLILWKSVSLSLL